MVSALSLAAGLAASAFAPFSPQDGSVKAPEAQFRKELCLNGKWRFQPVPIPAGYEWNKGIVPDLPLPKDDGWETTPIKIPSPWNVNNWGCGRHVGEGTDRPYDPDSLYYPSYPNSWGHVRMAWMSRTFALDGGVPAGTRAILHFEAVAGDCRVRVNGKDAGSHFDSYLPFDLDITELAREGENTVEVGVRDHKLFDRKEPQYRYMSAPYPTGSNTDGLCGIWQDVSFVLVPSVRVKDVFVKPDVKNDTLALEVTVRNDSGKDAFVSIGAELHDWINLAKGFPTIPEAPSWKLGDVKMSIPSANVQIAAGGETKVEISAKVNGRLRLWSPEKPDLSAAIVSLKADGKTRDCKYERFGWRQFSIRGRDLLLNGERIELKGDILHPFGPYSFSTRFVRAWYTMIKDMHGNAVRPHAQIYPRCYLDLADEMGLCVLDETAIFGSSIRCNFTMPEFWTRWEEHYRGLVLRDRNHPSVFGWSFGNEMFAIFRLNEVPDGPQKDAWYARMTEIGLKGREWDSTREWISCDGDEDLFGKLPVWSKHYGHHPHDIEKEAKGINKPLMVGENGGTYYARPADLYRLGAEAAYRDYAGRNEALAADVYSNYVCMARGRLAYWSASETAWFGLKPLPLGYADHSRLPGRKDGIFFDDVPDGTWGMQVERMPPYVTTFNPGFDKSLPLYVPLAMFEAQKAAQDPRGPQPCRWDTYPKKPVRPTPPANAATEENRLVIVSDAESLAKVNKLFGVDMKLVTRPATQFVRKSETDPAVASFTVDELYFAEAGDKEVERREAKRCLYDVPREAVLLVAANTDWSLFNRRPENAKVAAITCFEELEKPEGVVLAAFPDPDGKGRIFVTTVDQSLKTIRHRHFMRRFCANIGVPPPAGMDGGTEATEHSHDLLLDGPKD
ncbi:MAG: beta-galactosidase [Kiritimatiellae bacterium]|nr:beta-galactosidase [Kiritimatiellia bacterium]